ncbi:voltage-dependent calcium channel gamma-1 subunit [Sorex araneus]|uniref:voltage-dependent calcium channel gamma-1 subunit n=1 Tax=Sorex araneus TaxID=42254 RepID=UPI0024334E03|nr:voltage-dependent calcium channel gamma-1 subunit [Sorex araneus]
MSRASTLTVHGTLFCVLAGVVLALVAVATDHWAELSHHATCQATHFGLWRVCTKPLAGGDREPRSCGSTGWPGEGNCSYFRHLNPSQSSESFQVTAQKDYSISAAAMSIFSLGFAVLGTICVFLSFRKRRDYLLRPASMFYVFAGLCIFVSVEVMRQLVTRAAGRVDAAGTRIPYGYSWSFACACASCVLLALGGLALLLASLPRLPRDPWESCMDAELQR